MARMFILSFVVVFGSAASAFTYQPNVIYGKDDRIDLYMIENPIVREVALSTAAMIPSANLSQAEEGKQSVRAGIYGHEMGLCSEEAFYSQPSGAMCSGFLVGDDLLATAGHCITESSCESNSFVFNYHMTNAETAPTVVAQSDVYRCTQVLSRELTNNQDYALVKLDRPVEGRRALRLAANPVQLNDGIYVVGHPSGLPTKVAGGASIRRLETGYFVANLDTYGGNSGSAVFNTETNEVIGILVRGERDFRYDSSNMCKRSNSCLDSECRGEDVTLISYIIDALNQKH
ncbi:MAG: trypsin-like peptidase domain-containing protein [Bdellovibrionaceae bacterium]|nr:trypsin-like peptidase domain-containing protein [Pseudobdellovibrionaceae bacterium]MBX3034281.1 trypsin-like peptidase domain-containing protein [Pseudobdellovibrionaceae bacterium]